GHDVGSPLVPRCRRVPSALAVSVIVFLAGASRRLSFFSVERITCEDVPIVLCELRPAAATVGAATRWPSGIGWVFPRVTLTEGLEVPAHHVGVAGSRQDVVAQPNDLTILAVIEPAFFKVADAVAADLPFPIFLAQVDLHDAAFQ